MIAKGLSYLAKLQQPDGSFLSHSSPTIFPFNATHTHHTTFTNSLILDCLLQLPPSPKRDHIMTGLARWLWREMGDTGSWNYWARSSSTYRDQPYPDDLDDTFTALCALYRYEPSRFTGELLGKISQVLIACETTVGGPYRTWLVPVVNQLPDNPVDLVVNAMIAYFLSLQGVNLPHVTTLIEQAINKEQYVSQYYPSCFVPLYAISRSYHGPSAATISKHLLGHYTADRAWDTPLQNALAILTLRNLSSHPHERAAAAERLRATCLIDHWPAEGYCLDPARGRQRYYSGDSALTTAFCLAALHGASPPSIKAAESPQGNVAEQHRQIVATRVAKTLGAPSRAIVERLLAPPFGYHLTELVPLTAAALGKNRYTPETEQLSLATAYGWIAYTLFDDIVDTNETAHLLPLAQQAHSRMLELFLGVSGQGSWHKRVFGLIHEMNEAISWEVTYTRPGKDVLDGPLESWPRVDYGDYTILSQRSIGHALGPLALVVDKSTETRQLLTFFRHYLIARQLLDDAHDWQDDLERGQLNSAASLILTALPPGLKKQKYMKVKPRIVAHFWQDTILAICQIVDQQLAMSHHALEQISGTIRPDELFSLLDHEAQSVSQTRQQRQASLDFIATYQPRSKKAPVARRKQAE